MKIAFLCSSLEPGRDGVGDYTQRLVSELIRQGCRCIILGLNDSYTLETIDGQQEVEGNYISTLRLPRAMSWDERVSIARKWMERFDPDWISLQFVPFGFHSKGLCFGIGKILLAINSKAKWHIMFHELWLGLGKKSPIKHRFWGGFQRLIVMDVISKLHPTVVHTHAEPYQKALNRERIEASILPLFSGIPVFSGDGWEGLLEPLVTQTAQKYRDRTELYLAGIFGAVHPEWDAGLAVDVLLPLVHHSQKRLVLVFLGKSNLTIEAINKLKMALQDRAEIVTAGERSTVEVSKILQSLDLGLATSPRQMIQKSSSVATMLEHGLSVLVIRDDWHLRGADISMEEKSSRLFSPEQFSLRDTLPARDLQTPEYNNVKTIASRMLVAMKSI